LARTWALFGVAPAEIVADGTGDLAAAYLAGLLELDEALALAVARGRVIDHDGEPARRAELRARVDAVPRRVPRLSCHAAGTGAELTAAALATSPVRGEADQASRVQDRGISVLVELGAPQGTALTRQAGLPVIAPLDAGGGDSETPRRHFLG